MTNPNSTTRSRRGLRLAGTPAIVVTMTLIAAWLGGSTSPGPVDREPDPSRPVAASRPDHRMQPIGRSSVMWRYTRDGWQDVSALIETRPPQPSRWQQIHPLVWAIAILSSALGVAVWSANEWEWARLLEAIRRFFVRS